MQVKLTGFLSRDLETWRRTIGHLFYATSSFLHHFIAIDELRVGLQTGNDTFGLKLATILSLKFDGWTSITIEYLFYGTSNFLHHYIATGEFKLELQSGNIQFG